MFGNDGTLAKELQSLEVGHSAANIAAAAIDEPTFVGKARQLQEFLFAKIRNITVSNFQQGTESVETVSSPCHRLSFSSIIVGLDAAVRMFSTRFFTSQVAILSSPKTFFDVGGNCIVCARQSLNDGASQEDMDTEKRVGEHRGRGVR